MCVCVHVCVLVCGRRFACMRHHILRLLNARTRMHIHARRRFSPTSEPLPFLCVFASVYTYTLVPFCLSPSLSLSLSFAVSLFVCLPLSLPLSSSFSRSLFLPHTHTQQLAHAPPYAHALPLGSSTAWTPAPAAAAAVVRATSAGSARPTQQQQLLASQQSSSPSHQRRSMSGSGASPLRQAAPVTTTATPTAATTTTMPATAFTAAAQQQHGRGAGSRDDSAINIDPQMSEWSFGGACHVGAGVVPCRPRRCRVGVA